LRLELSTHSHGRVPSEVVELYFRARRHILLGGYSDVSDPLADLERCIAIAPGFGPAYALHAAAAARSWFVSNLLSSTSNAREVARSSVARAQVAAPEHPDTHLARGILALQELDAREAARALVRTLELAPTLALAQLYLGGIQMELGRLDEAKRRLRLAAELDPSIAAITEVTLCRMAYFDGDFLAYERHLEAVRRHDVGLARFVEVRAAIWSRSREHARHVLEEMRSHEVRHQYFAVLIGLAAGQIPAAVADATLAEFLAELDNPRLQQLVRQFSVDAFGALGEVEHGARWLDELMRHPFVDRDWLERSPALVSLRGTESYRQAVSKVRLLSSQILHTDLAATRSSYG
jgi:tetratricopeptide (TPR) repeat protein